MPIIKIISPNQERYNLQGFGLPALFEPGEVYNVPEFAARNMMDPTRNWARLARDDEIPAADPQAANLPQAPVHATMTTPPPDQAQSAEPSGASPGASGQSAEPPKADARHPASPAGRRSRR